MKIGPVLEFERVGFEYSSLEGPSLTVLCESKRAIEAES